MVSKITYSNHDSSKRSNNQNFHHCGNFLVWNQSCSQLKNNRKKWVIWWMKQCKDESNIGWIRKIVISLIRSKSEISPMGNKSVPQRSKQSCVRNRIWNFPQWGNISVSQRLTQIYTLPSTSEENFLTGKNFQYDIQIQSRTDQLSQNEEKKEIWKH